jgi:hypothetical protein
MVRTRCCPDGRLHAEGFAVSEVPDHLAVPGHTVWFDICPSQPVVIVTGVVGLYITFKVKDWL